jgi:hypothetical protein
MSLADRLRGLFGRGDGPIGALESAEDVDGWIRRLPHLEIATSAPGARGIFHGKVVGSPAGKAPLSGVPCLLGLLTIAQADGDVVEHALDVRTDFWLEDATGRARLRAIRVEPLLHLVTVREANVPVTDRQALATLYDGPRNASQWSHSVGVDIHHNRYDSVNLVSVFTHREQTVLPGDEVWVVGARGVGEEVTAGEAGGAGYRDGPRSATIVEAPDALAIYLTDAPAPDIG